MVAPTEARRQWRRPEGARSESTPLDHTGPALGSRLCCTVQLGPWSAEGTTTVRHQETGKELELEASFKALDPWLA
ncbi:hypothetical protein ACIBTP_40460 [Streptomyces avidinii]|uniref:hypothetical protein n=1 Tax=Streptomyces avidinii TaxID=1895 RepID=UPI003789C7E0